MAELRKYTKKPTSCVVAVQLDLDTEGFTYQKWGGPQRCKAGDWLVLNDGDTYTVDQETFSDTYELVSPGVFVKDSPVWARAAQAPGEIHTKEGVTQYAAGDYLVYNDPAGEDGYAVTKASFEAMYDPA